MPLARDPEMVVHVHPWAHLPRLGRGRLGPVRLSPALEAINDLYRNELRLMMNLFQPSVKLQRKVRVGSKLKTGL